MTAFETGKTKRAPGLRVQLGVHDSIQGFRGKPYRHAVTERALELIALTAHRIRA